MKNEMHALLNDADRAAAIERAHRRWQELQSRQGKRTEDGATDTRHNRTTPLPVGVLIVSNRGVSYVSRAVNSVARQDYAGDLHIVIVGDNTAWDSGEIDFALPAHVRITVYHVRGDQQIQSLPPVCRVARLRNVALSLVTEPLVCFLDDDNEWEINHVRSLVDALLKQGVVAAHSWRRLVDSVGRAWKPNRFPWRCNPARSESLFRAFVNSGLISRQDNIFRDSFVVTLDGENIAAVDMGAWLFDSRLFEFIRFETEYTAWDLANTITEDDKLLLALKELDVPVACTQLPTLIYRLGGYSNCST